MRRTPLTILRYAANRDVLKYFKYSKFYSVAMMLSELALPRFEEIIGKYRCELQQQMSRSNNDLVSLFLLLSVW